MSGLYIEGEVGRLEASFATGDARLAVGAVLCHPHPQFGGSMQDMVLGAMEPAFVAAGISALRFNFRGVGGSEGTYDDGRGEVSDVVAAVTWLREEQACQRVILAGYSFGGSVALQAQATLHCDALVLVAPAIGLVGDPPPPEVPSLVILAEQDQFVDAGQAEAWFSRSATEVRCLPADHFFFGKHADIESLVSEFVCRVTGGAAWS